MPDIGLAHLTIENVDLLELEKYFKPYFHNNKVYLWPLAELLSVLLPLAGCLPNSKNFHAVYSKKMVNAVRDRLARLGLPGRGTIRRPEL